MLANIPGKKSYKLTNLELLPYHFLLEEVTWFPCCYVVAFDVS